MKLIGYVATVKLQLEELIHEQLYWDALKDRKVETILVLVITC